MFPALKYWTIIAQFHNEIIDAWLRFIRRRKDSYHQAREDPDCSIHWNEL